MRKTGIALLCIVLTAVCAHAQEEPAEAQTADRAGKARDWKTSLSLGYNQQNGNTNKAQLHVTGEFVKDMEHSQFSAGANVLYSQADKKMDSQKWDSTVRYSRDFGDEYRWFNSYQLKVDHDRFADIDYRILPSVGLGYWFWRQDDWKWMAEGSLGYEITSYRSAKPDDEEPVAILRTYLEKQVLENARISEDFSVIPSLEGGGTRIKSITAFTNPLADNLDLEVKYTLDHDSKPPGGIKKTDSLFTVGVKYTY
ncbi:MAG: DUF481 domain-containing protein [Candidatus Omnitrophica bacterium]|nr:DUF481 domain-containing protein [Candidatus Omnitrophota bacterium]